MSSSSLNRPSDQPRSPGDESSVQLKRKDRKTNASTGASAAGIRAVSSQVLAFYFRAPVKAFFRTRVDYMAYARSINPRAQTGKWSWHVTTPGLLAHAVKEHGWSFIPNQVLPPLIANVGIGAVLYTSYLQILGILHEPSSFSKNRIYPPPNPSHTFAAGFIAGSIQSVVAAPLDALQVRFRTNEMLEGRYSSMWQYSVHKLKEIGLRGIFAGWTMSFLKDSLSCSLFFGTFEYTKAQLFYKYLPIYYHPKILNEVPDPLHPIRPHYLLEPSFILMAGVLATFAQQSVQYPLNRLQDLHFGRLEGLDYSTSREKEPARIMRLYYHAYLETFAQAKLQATQSGGWRAWLYKDFFWNTIRQTPSTSAGLIVFEILRRKYADSITEQIIVLDNIPFQL